MNKIKAKLIHWFRAFSYMVHSRLWEFICSREKVWNVQSSFQLRLGCILSNQLSIYKFSLYNRPKVKTQVSLYYTVSYTRCFNIVISAKRSLNESWKLSISSAIWISIVLDHFLFYLLFVEESWLNYNQTNSRSSYWRDSGRLNICSH